MNMEMVWDISCNPFFKNKWRNYAYIRLCNPKISTFFGLFMLKFATKNELLEYSISLIFLGLLAFKSIILLIRKFPFLFSWYCANMKCLFRDLTPRKRKQKLIQKFWNRHIVLLGNFKSCVNIDGLTLNNLALHTFCEVLIF